MLQLQFLLPPVIALMSLAFLFNTLLNRSYDARQKEIAFGILFGGIVVLGMAHPLSLGEGLIFDTRTLLVGAATVFVGPASGFIAVCFGLICRFVIGGAGMQSGLVGLVLAFGLSLLFARLLKGRIRSQVLHDAIFGLGISFAAVAFFILPFDLAVSLLLSVLPTLLFVNVVGMIVIGLVFRRESNQAEYTKRLAAYATTDSLTDLLNRRGMNARIQATKFDSRVGHAMLYFDVDDFKQVNDTYGHGAGDAALAIMAARIKDKLRGEAIFTRHGGDEFSIYFPRINTADLRCVADRVCACIADQAFTFDGMTFDVSISLGAYWSKMDVPIQDMIDYADSQLLLAKRAGKARVQVAYDPRGQIAKVA